MRCIHREAYVWSPLRTMSWWLALMAIALGLDAVKRPLVAEAWCSDVTVNEWHGVWHAPKSFI